MRTLFHDAFARFSLLKKPVRLMIKHDGNYAFCKTCEFCGSPGKEYTSHRTLFEFYQQDDDSLHGNKNRLGRGKNGNLFCSVGCLRSHIG